MKRKRGQIRYEAGADMQPTRAMARRMDKRELEDEKKAPTREVPLYSPHSIRSI